jgi:hypothetical protein
MSTPSLLNIPYVIKAGTLYSQIPETGAGDFTVTRATTPTANRSTRINANGFIELVNDNVPRLDYPLGGAANGCPALLVEPAATNFAPNVNLMTGLDTPTASGGVTLTTGSTDFLAPDGSSGSINKYVGGAASGNTQNSRYGIASLIVTASGTYRFSLFVKAGTTNPLNFCAIAFSLFTGGSGTSTSFFNLASGTAITAGASIENYGDGWYRCISAPYTIASGDLSGTVYFNLASSSSSISWPASGALNLTAYTWGAQMEAGTVATSYIPTTTQAITRAADVITKTGIASLIGQSEGTIYVEVDLRNTSSGKRLFLLSDGTSQNEIRVTSSATNAGDLQFAVRLAGTLIVNSFSPTNVYSNGIFKIAAVYKSTDYALYVNGLQVLTSSGAGNIPACNRVDIGSQLGTSNFLNDRIRSAALYPNRLTNTQLQTLTTP